MGWFYLLIAGFFEVLWALSLKFTEGFTKLGPSLAMLPLMALSLWFLSLSLKEIPLGTAYAVWTGIGAAGTFLLAILLFHEPYNSIRIFCIILIILGIVGLKLTEGSINP